MYKRQNTGLGIDALANNTTGGSNTAVGLNALVNNTTGFDNTASGRDVLVHNTSGHSNTAIGVGSLKSSVTGSSNTASGHSALHGNTTGDNNTAIGASALVSNNTGAANTANGISSLFFNDAGNFNTANGARALQNNTTGSNNTSCGVNALFNNSTGSNNTAIGVGADVFPGDLENATAVGAGALVNASNKIRLGNAAITSIEAPVGITVVSDSAVKENFQSVDGEEVLKKLRRVNVTSWNYIGHNPKEFRHYGPVAQEFYDAFGNDGVGKIGTATTITSTDLSGVLMIAIQALEKKNTEQSEEINLLRSRLDRLEKNNNKKKGSSPSKLA